MENYANIYIVGDIHGDYRPLVHAIDERPENALYVQVGDFGIGFPQTRTLDKVLVIYLLFRRMRESLQNFILTHQQLYQHIIHLASLALHR